MGTRSSKPPPQERAQTAYRPAALQVRRRIRASAFPATGGSRKKPTWSWYGVQGSGCKPSVSRLGSRVLCCLTRESGWLFRNMGETSSIGTQPNDAYENFCAFGFCLQSGGYTFLCEPNPRPTDRLLTNSPHKS